MAIRALTLPSRPSGAPNPVLPDPRGPLSAGLLESIKRAPHAIAEPRPVGGGAWAGDDLQLALYVCYELHYRSFAGVDDGWEWEPSLLGWRRSLETAFERGLRDLVGHPTPGPPERSHPEDVAGQLWQLIAEATGPSLSRYMQERGTLAQMREFAAHRSAYQLKEADPHTWGIPRLTGEPKAALVHIQSDEYGGGVAEAMHATLFANTMDSLELDSRYGSYLNWLPGITLATVNLISLFGLHRRWRGALVGHLSVFEMTSVTPMGRYSEALRRLGVNEHGRRFYDVHVEADAEHQHVAAHRLAGRLASDEPDLAGDILFGARAVMAVEELFARHLLDAWAAERTSLRRPLPPVPTTTSADGVRCSPPRT